MIPGVTFQPGSADQIDQQQGRRATGSQQGVQEAIKVLSLRMPKVVGAQASAPGQLLSSPGGGGRPHIDSIVEQVLQKFFPTGGAAAQPSAPMMPAASDAAAPEPMGAAAPEPTNAPSFTGGAGPAPRIDTPPPAPTPNFWTTLPKIVVTPDLPQGDFTVGSDGRPVGGTPGGVFEDAPDLRKNFDWMQSPSPWGAGGGNDGPPSI